MKLFLQMKTLSVKIFLKQAMLVNMSATLYESEIPFSVQQTRGRVRTWGGIRRKGGFQTRGGSNSAKRKGHVDEKARETQLEHASNEEVIDPAILCLLQILAGKFIYVMNRMLRTL